MLIAVVSPSFPRFDATTHYWQAEFASVVAFLRGQFPDARVVAVPAGLICAPDRVIVRELLEQPDFLVVWSRVWEAPATRKLAHLAGEISPGTRVLVWGDGPLFMPQYFRREPLDGVVISGDPELVLADAIRRLSAGGLPEHGMLVHAADDWIETERGLAGSGRLAVPRPERHRLRGLPACTGAARQADRRSVVRRQPWVPCGLCLVCRSLEGRAPGPAPTRTSDG